MGSNLCYHNSVYVFRHYMESERQESNLRHIAYKAIALPLIYIPSCFSVRTPDNRISNNLFSWDKFSRIIDRLYTDSIIPTKLIAGDGFEPPFSRIWTLRDSASLPCLVWIFSVFVPAIHKPTVSYISDSFLISNIYRLDNGRMRSWTALVLLISPLPLMVLFPQNPEIVPG